MAIINPSELDLKEDKVAWKWFSTNDYTDVDKSKVDNLPTDTNSSLYLNEDKSNK